jgi:ribonuclease HI
MKIVKLITDGGCIGNPGPGGWACIIRYGEKATELFGGERETTNNRMELRAAIEGLRALKEPCEVTVTSDSQYVIKGITEWIHGWKRRGWVKPDKQPVLNKDLWMELDFQSDRHYTKWEWTKGHANHADNNRCDELANAAARAAAKGA